MGVLYCFQQDFPHDSLNLRPLSKINMKFKKIDLGQIITICANIGVIAGIVFLGIELQQNNNKTTRFWKLRYGVSSTRAG